MKKPLALIIMDGFGINNSVQGNAIEAANTPNLDRFFAMGSHTQIGASGLNVGLPDGQMGNSEVGHYQYRRGPGCIPGADPDHQIHSGWGFL